MALHQSSKASCLTSLTVKNTYIKSNLIKLFKLNWVKEQPEQAAGAALNQSSVVLGIFTNQPWNVADKQHE